MSDFKVFSMKDKVGEKAFDFPAVRRTSRPPGPVNEQLIDQVEYAVEKDTCVSLCWCCVASLKSLWRDGYRNIQIEKHRRPTRTMQIQNVQSQKEGLFSMIDALVDF